MAHSGENQTRLGRRALDSVAIGLSALCVVHCLATLLLLATVASLGSVLADPTWHKVGLAVAILLAASSLGFGYFRHRSGLPLALGTVGLLLMGGSLLMDHGLWEFIPSVTGLGFVIFAHWRNMRQD